MQAEQAVEWTKNLQLDEGVGKIAGSFLIDAHVHCHACFNAADLLEYAWTGFSHAGTQVPAEKFSAGWLLFAEMPDDHVFTALAQGQLTCPGWSITRTDEPHSLIACKRDGALLILIAGRQIVTTEKLEVLALGTTQLFDSGLDLPTTIDQVRATGALAVLPWGVGKWLGRRGKLLRTYLKSAESHGLFLGDNGSRPALWPEPNLFAKAEARGIPILPGSDPLPLPGSMVRVGCYGFRLEGEVGHQRPCEGLWHMLESLERRPQTYGRLPSLWSSIVTQIRMQIKKRASKT